MLDEERANTVYNIYFCILINSLLHCVAIAFDAEHYDEISPALHSFACLHAFRDNTFYVF